MLSTKETSHFFGRVSRLKGVPRWTRKRNLFPEDVAQHSWEVSTLSFALAVIHNLLSPEDPVNPHRVSTKGTLHDAAEIDTGDPPTPVKRSSPEVEAVFAALEQRATQGLVNSLPKALREAFSEVMLDDGNQTEALLVKAADNLASLHKCMIEVDAGNREFLPSLDGVRARLESYQLPAVDYFLAVFTPSYTLSPEQFFDETQSRLSTKEQSLLGARNRG